MFGAEILDVAIGMVFLFLFMSMIASALREVIESVFQDRAKLLEQGLTEMLRNGKSRTWVEIFYKHPLISSLYKEDYVSGSRKLPAYIPKESFSLAILDLAAKASESNQLLSFAQLQATLQLSAVPDPIKRVLLTAVSTADGDLAQVRKSLEDWYDSTMDRVTGWYTKKTALFLFLLGFSGAVWMNVDAITIAKHLVTDKALREAVVSEATSYQRSAPAASLEGAATRVALKDPAGGKIVSPAAPSPSDGDGPDIGSQTFSELRARFEEIGYPIGWTVVDNWLYPAPQACRRTAERQDSATPPVRYICDKSGYFWMLVSSALGWLTTAIAIMLGAPFWFNLLNKLISLRTALKPSADTAKIDDASSSEVGT